MSLCLCSISFCLGAALDCRSAAAFCPSLVLTMAAWMLITATLPDWLCACRARDAASASMGHTNTLLFTVKLLTFEPHYRLPQFYSPGAAGTGNETWNEGVLRPWC